MLANHQIVSEQNPTIKSLETKCSLEILLADEIKHLTARAKRGAHRFYNV